MDHDLCGMMDTPMGSLTSLIQIIVGSHWQINFIFLLHRLWNGPLKTESLYVWKIRSSVSFGPQPFGNKLHIFYNILYFIHVSMEVRDKRRLCWLSMSVNFMR